MSEFPLVKLSEVVRLNPRNPDIVPVETDQVTFVPMAAVEAETGRFNASETRVWGAVKKGYTRFQENDVLVAKITPCMENGKACVARHLEGLVGAGSTEFHVLRPITSKVEPEWILRFVNQRRIRHEAKRHMSGAVGQQRVPASFYQDLQLPLPDLETQQELLEHLEEHDVKIEATERALFAIQAKLKQARASILKAAVEGRLVQTEAELARQSGSYYEDAEELLERVALEAAIESSKTSTRSGPVGTIKPSKADDLPELPEGWAWVQIKDIAQLIRNGYSGKPTEKGTVPILRISSVRAMSVDPSDTRRLEGVIQDYEKSIALKGHLLITRYNGNPDLVGVMGLMRSPEPLVHPDKLIRVEIDLPCIDNEWVEIAFNTGITRNLLRQRIRTTAGQAGISGQDVKQMPIPIPPINEQHRIVAEVQRRFSVLDQVEATVNASLRRCGQLRQAVLKRAFGGIGHNANRI